MIPTQPTHTARQPGDDSVRRSVLPSGLRVVTEAMPGSETFAVGFFVGVGSVDETKSRYGAAHYLEHVLFKGTPTRSAEEISAAFDAVGGDANAYTSREHTCFYAKVLADDTDIALDVLQDMLTRSLILPEDVDAEREVILDEIDMHDDDAMETAYSLVTERLYPARLGREVIGTKESIRAMSREQVRRFWKQHYGPSNVVVAAAGKVDHDALVARLAGWPAGTLPPGRPSLGAPRGGALLATRRKEQEQAACLLTFPGLTRGDERRYAAELLATALGGGMSARLFVEVREHRGLAYHIDASTQSYAAAGMLAIEWLSSPRRIAEILDVVAEVCADVVANGISAAELARVQGQLRGQLLLGFESPESRMMRLGRTTLHDDPRTMADVLAGYAATTADDVRAVAAQLLAQRPTMAVVGGTVERSGIERRLRRWAPTMQGATQHDGASRPRP